MKPASIRTGEARRRGVRMRAEVGRRRWERIRRSPWRAALWMYERAPGMISDELMDRADRRWAEGYRSERDLTSWSDPEEDRRLEADPIAYAQRLRADLSAYAGVAIIDEPHKGWLARFFRL